MPSFLLQNLFASSSLIVLFPFQVDMTHCYDLMKEKAVLESLDTGAEKRSVQEERKHHANMMKENDEWNKEVR